MQIDSAGIRFGTVLSTREAGGFLLRKSRYAPGLRLPHHHHEHSYFSFVVSGAILERDPRRVVLHEAGSLHFHPAGDPHSAETGPLGVTCLSVGLTGRNALRLQSKVSTLLYCPPHLASIACRCDREIGAMDSASDLALEALCLEMLAATLRWCPGEGVAEPAWLREAHERIHECLDSPPTVAELAQSAGVHPSHLARAFRRRYGASPGSYLRGLRIERARETLARTTEPVAAIALQAGFSSQAHFTRVFHRLVGLPPALYRRLHGTRRQR